MTREEVTERFNKLPREHRVTIIGSELDNEIRCLEREKTRRIASHREELLIINGRIKDLTRALENLNDD